MSSSPTSGSAPTVQSLEPPADSVSPSVSAPPLLMLLKVNKHQKIKKKKKREACDPEPTLNYPACMFTYLHICLPLLDDKVYEVGEGAGILSFFIALKSSP